MNKLKCNLCGHEWTSYLRENPVACPKCKRYDWNKKKEEKENGE